MIKNERQYRISKTQVSRFQHTLDGLQRGSSSPGDLHPRIMQAQIDAVRSQLTDLEEEIREYEALKRGEFQLEHLMVINDLATLLIKARIASGWSQRELAQRVGIKEQQVQQYEATDYQSASLHRLQEVAQALGVKSASDLRRTA